MQEPAAVDGSLENGNAPLVNGAGHSPSPDQSSTGFTAVNDKRPALSQSSDTPHSLSAPPAAQSALKTSRRATQYQSHGWRPSDTLVNGGHVDAEPVIGKRKRSDPLGRQSSDGGAQTQTSITDEVPPASPVNRPTTVHAAVDRSPSEHSDQPSALSQADSDLSDVDHDRAYSRENSPVERWNKGEPPPKPRPETEASLAASVQQFQQQTQQGREALHNQGYSPRYPSPAEEREYVGESHIVSDDPYGDPKRRKRNFSNRTKTGCHTCRKRKKKCDEGKPFCLNCTRGSFECEGYGPKPPNFKLAQQGRAVMPLQSKTPMPPYNGRQTDGPSVRPEEGRSYSHWGRVPPPPPPPPPPAHHHPLPPPSESEPPRPFVPVAPADPRRPNSSVDNWHKPSYAPPHVSQPHPYPNDRLPPNFPPMPSLQSPYPHDQHHHHPQLMHQYPPPHHGAPPPLQPPHSRHSSSSHLPPMPLEPWAHPSNVGLYPQPHQSQPGPPPPAPPIGSSRGSATSASHRSDSFQLGYTSSRSLVEKDKMLRGQPYLHYLDPVLCQERQSCKAAVERYNKAAETTSGISDSERGKLFTQILKPQKRADAKPRESQHAAPDGSIGDHSIVEPPFKCEYGYNIHIGSKCIVESDCFFQDAADIYLGHRVVVGHNVKMYCRTMPVDPSARNKGSQSDVVAGAIRIEDDCFIGADVVIMPFVTVRRGAVVGAGSVVTKDVEENTVVAGNPAKLIRRIEGANMGRHHSQQVQRQQEEMINRMVRYANSNFTWYNSPRL